MSDQSVLALAEQIFGSHEMALLWLGTTSDRLGGRTPISAMDSASGIREVTKLLWGIDEGIYT